MLDSLSLNSLHINVTTELVSVQLVLKFLGKCL